MNEIHHPLLCISPLDGRYSSKTAPLSGCFSEAALLRFRVMVEARYFLSLCRILPQLKDFPTEEGEKMMTSLYEDFGLEDALAVKDIEKTTNHDVKAVEYYIKGKMKQHGYEKWMEFVHFGLTSQDINNTAFPLMIKEGVGIVSERIDSVIGKLSSLSREWADVPMLARTHGQPASPTFFGKEVGVFVERLKAQMDVLRAIRIHAKFGGATGGMNAMKAAYPEIDWKDFCDKFVESLGLERSYPTTQIDHYDSLSQVFDCLRRIGTILTDLCRDFWMYISLGYLRQRVVKGEVGSSAMPHKVNPIDFENAEGNLLYAGAIYSFLSGKLPISRLQRDLTDSTVIRNAGVPLAHTLIALESLLKGLGKLDLGKEAIQRDLDANWEVISEGIQTILRREGYPNPYETLKALTRTGGATPRDAIASFIEGLDVSESVKEELRGLSPETYTGYPWSEEA